MMLYINGHMELIKKGACPVWATAKKWVVPNQSHHEGQPLLGDYKSGLVTINSFETQWIVRRRYHCCFVHVHPQSITMVSWCCSHTHRTGTRGWNCIIKRKICPITTAAHLTNSESWGYPGAALAGISRPIVLACNEGNWVTGEFWRNTNGLWKSVTTYL